MTIARDAFKASRRQFRQAENQSSPMTDASPLVLDFTPGPLTGTHWVVTDLNASIVAAATAMPATALPFAGPCSGLFLVPQGAPRETIGDANVTGLIGMSFGARAIEIETRCAQQSRGGVGNFVSFLMTTPDELIVPAGWTIRLIVLPAPFTANPGPGAGSFAIMAAMVIEESDGLANG